MLKLNATRPDKLLEKDVYSAATIGAEGLVLMRVIEAGEETVKASAGASGEIFVGFSWMHNILPSIVSKVMNVTVSATPFNATLMPNLLAANVQIVRDSDGTVLTEGNPASADEYSVVDLTGVVTFHSADEGETMTCTFRYSPSALELKFMYPDADVNINPAFEVIGSIGVITEGAVYTDQFDASVDWSTATALKMGAGGLVNAAGSVSIPNARVVHVPDVDNPFLGIEF